jgi:hypothetical protein
MCKNDETFVTSVRNDLKICQYEANGTVIMNNICTRIYWFEWVGDMARDWGGEGGSSRWTDRRIRDPAWNDGMALRISAVDVAVWFVWIRLWFARHYKPSRHDAWRRDVSIIQPLYYSNRPQRCLYYSSTLIARESC